MHQPPGCNFLNVIVFRHLVVKAIYELVYFIFRQARLQCEKPPFMPLLVVKTLECAKNVPIER